VGVALGGGVLGNGVSVEISLGPATVQRICRAAVILTDLVGQGCAIRELFCLLTLKCKVFRNTAPEARPPVQRCEVLQRDGGHR
jgi:hypothetical protein